MLHITDKPLVSVIIPTRNRSHLLSRALNSVLAQTYAKFEIVVIDDGSEDNTLEVINDYKQKTSQVRYLHNQEPLGAAEARNVGLELARGEYIAFLDDDDEWFPEKVARQLSFLEENPDVGVVSCWHLLRLGKRSLKITKPKEVTFDDLLWGNPMGSFSFCMLRKNSLNGVDLKLRPEAVPGDDWDLWLRLSQKNKMRILPEYLVSYYDHPGPRLTNSTGAVLAAREYFYREYSYMMSKGCRLFHLSRIHYFKMKLATSKGQKLKYFLNYLYYGRHRLIIVLAIKVYFVFKSYKKEATYKDYVYYIRLFCGHN